MLTGMSVYWGLEGGRMEFSVPHGATAARLLIVAPTKEEITAIEQDETRRLRFRGAMIQVQTALFGAMPLDFAAMMAGQEPRFKEPVYGTLNANPEGYSVPEWLAAQDIPIIGGGRWVHIPLLDRLRVVDKNGWAAALALLMSGFDEEPITMAFTPRPGVLAIMQKIVERYRAETDRPIEELKGFDWVFITTHGEANEAIRSVAWYRF